VIRALPLLQVVAVVLYIMIESSFVIMVSGAARHRRVTIIARPSWCRVRCPYSITYPVDAVGQVVSSSIEMGLGGKLQ